MATKSEIRVGVKFETDNKQLELSKQKLTDLTRELQKIQDKAVSADLLGKPNDNLTKAAKTAKELETILNNS
jgi:hypothetical protein